MKTTGLKINAVEHQMLSLLAVVLLTPFLGCERSPSDSHSALSQPTRGADVSSGVVTLEIVEADEVRTITVPGVADGATLESVLRSVQGSEFVISGNGTTAFVNQIGKRATSGSEGWTFTVDGKWADKGIGATKLHPPATIRWKFGTMEAR